MPTKKKTSKKSRAKKPASKKPAVKAAAAKPVKEVKPVASPAAPKAKPSWAAWLPLLAVAVPVLFSVLYVLARPDDSVTTGESSQSLSDSPSQLRVVPGEQGGSGSNQASDALQPQPSGLQQSKPTTQSADDLNLQAQTTPDQTTIR